MSRSWLKKGFLTLWVETAITVSLMRQVDLARSLTIFNSEYINIHYDLKTFMPGVTTVEIPGKNISTVMTSGPGKATL